MHYSPPVSGGRRVFIAIPSYGPLPVLTTLCLLRSQTLLDNAGIDVEIAFQVGHCHIDDARNMLVAEFLRSECDTLMFIDADMGWQADELLKILEYDKDVVAGIYPHKKDDPEYSCWHLPGEIQSVDGLVEVELVPTGFLKLSRECLEIMHNASRKYQTDEFDDEVLAEIFCRDVVDGKRMSGDFNFCRRWPGQVYIDPELHLDHIGERQFSGCYGSYLRRMNGLDLSRGIQAIREGTETPNDIIDLWYEWGDNAWTAGHELVKTMIDVARQAKGPIIEIGSGLTTLVMTAAGAEVHSLEHNPVWLRKLQETADRLDLPINVHFAPLKDYPEGRWYDDSDMPWERADIVFCDGPPRQEGNRAVLLTKMAENNCNPRCMIQDDIECMEQAPVISGYGFEVMGEIRKFVVGKKLRKAA